MNFWRRAVSGVKSHERTTREPARFLFQHPGFLSKHSVSAQVAEFYGSWETLSIGVWVVRETRKQSDWPKEKKTVVIKQLRFPLTMARKRLVCFVRKLLKSESQRLYLRVENA